MYFLIMYTKQVRAAEDYNRFGTYEDVLCVRLIKTSEGSIIKTPHDLGQLISFSFLRDGGAEWLKHSLVMLKTCSSSPHGYNV